jgi:hypothetical protein
MIRAHVQPKDENTWIFSNRVNEFVGVLECSEFFVRSQLPLQNVKFGILFELAMHCMKKVIP